MKTNLKNPIKKAFTLIELMVAITIIWILSLAVYAPYSQYQTKARVNETAKSIAKSLSEARNFAINGVDYWSWNLSIWLYLDKDSEKITFFSYPFSYTWSQITNSESWEIKKIKEIDLLQNIKVNSLSWSTSYNNWLFFFEAISGKWKYLSFSPNSEITTNENWIISINISLWWATSWIFTKTVDYYTKTNVVNIR